MLAMQAHAQLQAAATGAAAAQQPPLLFAQPGGTCWPSDPSQRMVAMVSARLAHAQMVQAQMTQIEQMAHIVQMAQMAQVAQMAHVAKPALAQVDSPPLAVVPVMPFSAAPPVTSAAVVPTANSSQKWTQTKLYHVKQPNAPITTVMEAEGVGANLGADGESGPMSAGDGKKRTRFHAFGGNHVRGRPHDDGYFWLKYGRKELNTDLSLLKCKYRDYYKCVINGCTARKQVEYDEDGTMLLQRTSDHTCDSNQHPFPRRL